MTALAAITPGTVGVVAVTPELAGALLAGAVNDSAKVEGFAETMRGRVDARNRSDFDCVHGSPVG
jgi:hypothetical protein